MRKYEVNERRSKERKNRYMNSSNFIIITKEAMVIFQRAYSATRFRFPVVAISLHIRC